MARSDAVPRSADGPRERSPRVALAMCRSLEPWEVDDRPFVAALRDRGVTVDEPAWDDEAYAWEAADLVLIRCTWDYVPRRDEFVAWTRQVAQRTRLHNPPAVVAWNTDKRYLRALGQAGVPLAPTVWLDEHAPSRSERPVARALAELDAAGRLDEGPAFLKPVVGANASDTLRFDPRDATAVADAERLVVARSVAARGFMLQPYLGSVETFGEVSVVVLDGEVTHGVRKVPVPGDYRVQDDHGASDEAWEPDAEALGIASQALAVTAELVPQGGELLVARVDLLRDERAGRWCLNELELVEPSLFFRHGPAAPARLADGVLRRLGA